MGRIGDPCLDRMAKWLGCEWTPQQIEQFNAYAIWLATEGIDIGGLGPAEVERIWPRHICDALSFGTELGGRRSILDVGTGVGLPGVPLAIAFPDVDVTLVDRSGRRLDALRRIQAILGLRCEIVHGSVEQVSGTYDRVVFRASLPLESAIGQAARLMAQRGDGWFGLGRGVHPAALDSWRQRPPVPDRGLVIDEVCLPAGILDSAVWLLRMTRP